MEAKRSWREVDVFSEEFAANAARGAEEGARQVAAVTPEIKKQWAREHFSGTGNQKLEGMLVTFFGGK